MPSTDAILAESEEQLLRACRVEFYKSGGPGGQKRNKTSSAARIVHVPSGVEAHSNDFRSQTENRVRALHRLRFKIAATQRSPMTLSFYEPPAWLRKYVSGSKLLLNPKNHDFARAAAHLLDLLHAAEGDYARAAALIGASTSSVIRWLKQEHVIWDAACAIRRANGLSVTV